MVRSRILKRVGIGGLVLGLEGAASLTGADGAGRGEGLLAVASRMLPATVLTVEAEDRDVETTIAITILDHVPDLRRTLGSVRRLVAHP